MEYLNYNNNLRFSFHSAIIIVLFFVQVEKSGDPWLNYEPHQDLSFWECLYFILVTSTTVGECLYQVIQTTSYNRMKM